MQKRHPQFPGQAARGMRCLRPVFGQPLERVDLRSKLAMGAYRSIALARHKENRAMPTLSEKPRGGFRFRRSSPAALMFGALATAPAHATEPEDPCTKELANQLLAARISQLAATNLAVAAETDGDFAVTWDVPDEAPVPPGAVIGFCLEKEHEDGDDWVGCWYKEGLGAHFIPTASSLDSITADSCYNPRRHRRAPLPRRHPTNSGSRCSRPASRASATPIPITSRPNPR